MLLNGIWKEHKKLDTLDIHIDIKNEQLKREFKFFKQSLYLNMSPLNTKKKESFTVISLKISAFSKQPKLPVYLQHNYDLLILTTFEDGMLISWQSL